jgi:hypothetical protein
LTLNDDGAVWGGTSYNPWGQVESGSVPTFGFTGELQDSPVDGLSARQVVQSPIRRFALRVPGGDGGTAVQVLRFSIPAPLFAQWAPGSLFFVLTR